MAAEFSGVRVVLRLTSLTVPVTVLVTGKEVCACSALAAAVFVDTSGKTSTPSRSCVNLP